MSEFISLNLKETNVSSTRRGYIGGYLENRLSFLKHTKLTVSGFVLFLRFCLLLLTECFAQWHNG